MGSKDKAWFLLPETNERWLFKYARVNQDVSTGEHWAEKVAAEIAELIGIPHCLVEFAEFDGRMGSLSRRFPELARLTPWLERLRGLDIAQLSAIVHRVPQALMPEQSRRFCIALLGYTLQHLQNLK